MKKIVTGYLSNGLPKQVSLHINFDDCIKENSSKYVFSTTHKVDKDLEKSTKPFIILPVHRLALVPNISMYEEARFYISSGYKSCRLCTEAYGYGTGCESCKDKSNFDLHWSHSVYYERVEE